MSRFDVRSTAIHTLFRAVSIPTLLSCVVACGAAESSTDECAPLRAQCGANQQACIVGESGPQCGTCGDGLYATVGGVCESIGGTPLAHDFPTQTTTSGQEVIGLCRSWTLDNDTELWVNAVQLAQNEGSHHSNWVFVPESDFTGPDDIWTCTDRNYDFYTAVNEGGVLYAQSTQTTGEVQKFPSGAAVRVPAHSRIISDIHLLNTTPGPITGHAHLTLYSIPASDVKTALTSFHMEYDALTIPPHADSRFTGDCAVGSDLAKASGEPFDLNVYYLLPHTHTLATAFIAEVLGGPHDGEGLLDVGAYNGEAHGRAFDPPAPMAGSNGFRFGCQYKNPRATSVGWGFGTNEMCELFGFGDAKTFFQSRVSVGAAAGDDGSVQLFTGSCSTVVDSPQ